MNKLECRNCKHFIQHYIKENSMYKATYCGNCIKGNDVQTLLCYSKVCALFNPNDISTAGHDDFIIKPKDRN